MRTPRKCWSLTLPVFLLGLSGLLYNPVEAQIYAEVRGGTAVGSHTATAAAMELEPGLSVAGLISLQTSEFLAYTLDSCELSLDAPTASVPTVI